MARPNLPKDTRLAYKISRLYYEQAESESAIAERLHLSRARVSRLLDFSRKSGIVQITVLSPAGMHPDLEDQLEREYDLQEAIVVEADNPQSQEAVTKSIGVAAARYLRETLRDGETIGISWGTTLHAMVTAVQPAYLPHSHVVQIIGGLGPPTSEVHATDLCRRLASALHCKLTLLPAPVIVGSRPAKEAVLSDPYINHALQLIPHLEAAFVGIGAPTPQAVLLRDGSIISPIELDGLLSRGAVGDIALRFFDTHGQPIESELNQRVIGVTHAQIKSIPRVVGVAGGPEKFNAIRGALRGKYLKVLITDHLTAQRLTEEISTPEGFSNPAETGVVYKE